MIPFFNVDLPVIAGLMDSEGNPEFPLCDVTQYLPFYTQPGEAGTIYLYAHARRGMLADMLAASEVNDGAAMIGQEIIVYTTGGWRHVYSISIVKRHATDYSLADEIGPDQERLIVQTSEGPATDPLKLQVAAVPVSADQVPLSEAIASPEPRECPPAE
jgi:hypothetical protein